MTRNERWTLGLVTLLLIGWVGWVITAHAYVVSTDQLQRTCQLAEAGLSSDSLFRAATPWCH
jgi:hypothetical protein